MKKIILLIALCLIFSTHLFAWRSQEMEVRVFLNSQQDYQTLHTLKLNGDVYPNGEASGKNQSRKGEIF